LPFYCGKQCTGICFVLSPEKASTYSSEYASGFSEPAVVYPPAPSSPRDEGQCRTGSSSNPTRRLRKSYCGAVEIQWPARLREEENATQDAQKGCPARPQRAKRRRRTLRYVELLSEARTPLADFFSILLAPAR